MKTPTPGRGWAYACAQLGGAVSIAANYAHSYVPPKGAPAHWSPEVGAVAFSVFWPVAVFFAVEAFARVSWPEGRRWVALRFLGLLPVALVAAVVSYVHLSDLLAHYGAGGFESTIGPLAVDGLMVIGTGALIATSRARVAPLEVAASVVEDVPDPWAYAEPIGAEPTANEPAPVVATFPQPSTRPEPPAPAATPRATRRPAKRQTAAERVARAAARNPAATPAQLAARLKLSERTVQRYLPRPADDIVTTAERPSEPVNGHAVDLVTTN